jgi:hypothetical protein
VVVVSRRIKNSRGVRRRIRLDLPLGDWLATATAPPLVQRLAISPAVAAGAATLPDAFHRDPADRLIVASAQVLGVTLLTQDRRIIEADLVPILYSFISKNIRCSIRQRGFGCGIELGKCGSNLPCRCKKESPIEVSMPDSVGSQESGAWLNILRSLPSCTRLGERR